MKPFNLPSVEEARPAWALSTGGVGFRHLQLFDVIDREMASACAAEYPPPDGPWHTFTGPLEEGKQEGSASIAGPAVAHVHAMLAGGDFVTFLREMTGIPDLITDPQRVGGGIHQCGPGGRLGMHTDFNVHPARQDLVRAINVILFLGAQSERWNRRLWREEWGGCLELGPPEHWYRVMPDAGVMVIFEASDTGWHGHPQPMSADAPLRRSIPAYYYRPIREGETIEPHSTRFLEGDKHEVTT